jgi:nicotinate-nucleotide adenylyltransferase
MARLGIFGGSFNPVHNGHLVMAQEALEFAGLDRMLWIPAQHPPHKKEPLALPASLRRELLELALANFPGHTLDCRELTRPGPSFSVITAREVQREYPDHRLHFLIGEDSLADLHRWHAIEELCGLVEFLVAPRAGAGEVAADLLANPNFRVRRVPGTPIAISATLVRSRMRAGKSLRGYVPLPVEQRLRSDANG